MPPQVKSVAARVITRAATNDVIIGSGSWKSCFSRSSTV